MQRKHYAQPAEAQDASRLRVGVAVSAFNTDITDALLEGALAELARWGVRGARISIVRVPGSFELPLACMRLATTKKFDALVALGCVIKGETRHDEYISHAVAGGIVRVMLDTKVPIGFGVITSNTLAQAHARSRGTAHKGREAVRAALAMALIR